MMQHEPQRKQTIRKFVHKPCNSYYMDGNEFGKRAQEIKIKDISFHIDWKLVEIDLFSHTRDIRNLIYPIFTLERDGKTKRVSLYKSRYTKKEDGKLSSLGIAILYLVQGNAISKPAKDSINMMWITYTVSNLMKIIKVKLTGAASRKSIINKISKFQDRKNKDHIVSKLKTHLKDAHKAGLKKQDLTNLWNSIVNESIVVKVMEE
jgi:hypothetical protein